MKKTKVVLFLVGFLANSANAAKDVAYLTYSQTSSETFDSTNPLLSDVEVENATLEFSLPLGYFGDKTSGLGLGIAYKGDEFTFTDNVGNSIDQQLHALSLSAFYTWRSNNWKYTLFVRPGIHSDFDKVDSDDVLVRGGYVAKYKSSDNVGYSVGVLYGQNFGQATVIPAASVNYRIGDNLNIVVGIPRLGFNYRINSYFESYFSVAAAGGEWNVELENALNDTELDFQKRAIRTSLGVRMNVVKNYWVNLEVGAETNREVTAVVNGIENNDVELNDAAFLQLKFSYRK